MRIQSSTDANAGEHILHAGWLIDGTGGPLQVDRQIVIRSGHIHAIGPFESGHDKAPEPEIINLTHCTLLPVLMDAHVHLTLSGTREPVARQAQLHQSVDAAYAAIAKHLDDQQRHGVAAVRHAGDHRGDLLSFMRGAQMPIAVRRTGWAWYARGRYGRMIGQFVSEDEYLDLAVKATAEGVDHIKIINSGINRLDRFGDESRPQFSKNEMNRVCRFARKLNLPVMVHANGQEAVQEAVSAGCTSIEHGYFMGPDNLRLMADSGTVWVPTVVPMAVLAHENGISTKEMDVARRTLEHQLDQIAQGHEKGVTIALGTDAGSFGVDHGVAVKQEVALLMTAGLSVGEAVRCASLNTARLMGFDQGGVILPGRPVALMAVRGGPEKMPNSLGDIEAVYDPYGLSSP